MSEIYNYAGSLCASPKRYEEDEYPNPSFYFSSLDEFLSTYTYQCKVLGRVIKTSEYNFEPVLYEQLNPLFKAAQIGVDSLTVWLKSIVPLTHEQKVYLYYILKHEVPSPEVKAKLEYCIHRVLTEPSPILEGTVEAVAKDVFNRTYLDGLPEYIQHWVDYERFASEHEGSTFVEFDYNYKTYVWVDLETFI